MNYSRRLYDIRDDFWGLLGHGLRVEDIRGFDHEIMTTRHDDIEGRHTRLTKSTRKMRYNLTHHSLDPASDLLLLLRRMTFEEARVCNMI
jgi:hypothetical protein